jgi:hypothetical protein
VRAAQGRRRRRHERDLVGRGVVAQGERRAKRTAKSSNRDGGGAAKRRLWSSQVRDAIGTQPSAAKALRCPATHVIVAVVNPWRADEAVPNLSAKTAPVTASAMRMRSPAVDLVDHGERVRTGLVGLSVKLTADQDFS